MNKLRFGIGGIPHTAKGLENGISRLAELGLEHMELEFVQSVFVKEDKAPAIKEHAEKEGITLTAHGSYYTNFASEERPKWHASISRIQKAAKITDMVGGKSVTYHSGFFQGREFSEVKEMVKDAMKEILDKLKEDGHSVNIAPELTGKESQIGNLPQLIEIIGELAKEGYDNVSLCIDFAHNYARYGGKWNTYDEFSEMIEMVATGLGEKYLEHLHMHVSAITYGDKGEKNHLVYLPDLAAYKAEGVEVEGIETAWDKLKDNRFEENKFNWQDLLKALKKHDVGGYLVCESPILELDGLLMQKYYQGL